MQSIKIDNQKGFTLLEVLIGLVIFAVGILGVNAMQIASIKGNSKGRQISEATNIGSDQIEQILSWVYNHQALIDDDDGKDGSDNDGDVNGGDGTNQDGNDDGIDDDGGNFGLDDLTNPDGAADRDGDGTNDIFWNIAIDHPEDGMKTVKVIVDPHGNRTNNVELVLVKVEGL
jgi:type IV pilus assembly protein PilV